jgi:hypothetical protein
MATKSKDLGVLTHISHMGSRKCFFFSPISPHSYPIILNFFPNKFYYYFHFKNVKT